MTKIEIQEVNVLVLIHGYISSTFAAIKIYNYYF